MIRAMRSSWKSLVSNDFELIDHYMSGIKMITAIFLALNYPTLVSTTTYSLANAYKNFTATALVTKITLRCQEDRFLFC